MKPDGAYFDPRRKEEQALKDFQESMQAALEEVKADEKKQKNVEMGAKAAAALGTLFISPLILMVVWNAFIPGLFGLVALNYWHSMGIIVISRLIFPKND